MASRTLFATLNSWFWGSAIIIWALRIAYLLFSSLARESHRSDLKPPHMFQGYIVSDDLPKCQRKPVDCFFFPNVSRQIHEVDNASQIDLCRCHLIPQDEMASISAVVSLVKAPNCYEQLLENAEHFGIDDDDVKIALDRDQPALLSLCREICNSPSLKAQVLKLPCEESHAFQTQVGHLQHLTDKLADEKLRNALTRLLVKIAETSASNISPDLLLRGVELIQPVVLFSGGFGQVYQGTYNGQIVAIKQRLPSLQNKGHHLILREAATWMTLQHHYILPMIGVQHVGNSVTGDISVWIVSPWMDNGTLCQFRSRHGRRRLRKWCLQIAEGLEYLHSKNVVHGDIRGANILINGEENVQIADFGLSVFHDATWKTATNDHGATYWMAPELFTSLSEFKRTKESDVYAFACTLLQLYTGERPWSNKGIHSISNCVTAGERPAIPCWSSDRQKGIPQEIAAIITQCWEQTPSKRLTMKQVVEALAG